MIQGAAPRAVVSGAQKMNSVDFDTYSLSRVPAKHERRGNSLAPPHATAVALNRLPKNVA
jgi:hypothetical protein